MYDELADDHLKRIEIVNSILRATKEKIMSVKRSYFGDISVIRVFHVFCDVSRRAYVAVAYFVYQKEVCSVKGPDNANTGSTTRRRTRIINFGSRVDGSLPIGVLIASTIIIALEPLWINLLVFFWSESMVH